MLQKTSWLVLSAVCAAVPPVAAEELRPGVPDSNRTVDSCADPMVLRGRGDDRSWYMYCTTDPLHGADVDESGAFRFRRIPQLKSNDLQAWVYVGDAFPQGPEGLPPFAEEDAALWAPDVVWSEADNGDGDGQYLLLFGVTDTVEAISGVSDCDSDNAIGYATGESPTGPWTFAEAPLVAPRAGGEGCNFKWSFDPDVLGDSIGEAGTLYFGSYYGGIYAAPLTVSPEGAQVDAAAATMAAIDNRYEGGTVVERDGWFYLFASATDCCNGALTGYTVFVGRSDSPTGPFLDREGQPMTDAAAGGTPFLTMTGDRWVGPGHNILVEDETGAWWTFYHAVDRFDPYFPGRIAEGERGFTRRPVLRQAVTWEDGWPRVEPLAERRLGPEIAEQSDGFDGPALSDDWTWMAGSKAGPEPDAVLEDGVLRLPVQTGDTYVDADSASLLTRAAPEGDFAVEVRVRTSVPDTGCCFNFAQAGIALVGDEDTLVKLTETAIFNTRQTEWAKEIAADRVPQGWARYGNSVVGPPGAEWTHLRIVVERREETAADPDTHRFTAYSSRDGEVWVRGGTWTHSIGAMRIALVAMGRQPEEGAEPLVAEFDDLRVYGLEASE